MPAAAVIPVVLGVTGASAAIGATVATAIGLGTVSAVAATAIGTGLVAGVMTAAQGGDAGDVLKSAVLGGVTSFVGGTIAGSLGDANFVAADAAQLAAQGLGEAAIVQNLVGAGVSEAAAAAAAAQAVLGAGSFAIQQAVLSASGGGTDIFAQPQAYTGLSSIPPDDITALMQEGYSASNLSELALDGVGVEDLYGLNEAGYNPTELTELVNQGFDLDNLYDYNPQDLVRLSEAGLDPTDIDLLTTRLESQGLTARAAGDYVREGFSAADIERFGEMSYSPDDINALQDLGASNETIRRMADGAIEPSTVKYWADQGYSPNGVIDELVNKGNLNDMVAEGPASFNARYPVTVTEPVIPTDIPATLPTTPVPESVATKPAWMPDTYTEVPGSGGTQWADPQSGQIYSPQGEIINTGAATVPTPTPITPPVETLPEFGQTPSWLPEGSQSVTFPDGTPGFQAPGSNLIYDASGNIIGDASQLTAGGIQAGIPTQIPAGPADLVSTGVSDSAPGTILMGPQGPEVVLDNGKTVLIDDYVRALDSGQTLTVDGTALTPATADAGTTLQTGATTPGQINITGAPLQAGAELPAGTELPPGTRLATSAEIDAGLAGDSAVDLGDGTFAWITQASPTGPAVPGMDIDVTDLIPGPAPTTQPPPVDTGPVAPPPVIETPPPVVETQPPPVDTGPVAPPPVIETPPPMVETQPPPVVEQPLTELPPLPAPPPAIEQPAVTTPPVTELPLVEAAPVTGPVDNAPTTIQPIAPGETQPTPPATTTPTQPVLPDYTAPDSITDYTNTLPTPPPAGPQPAPIDTATNVVPGTNQNSGITPAQNLAGAVGERLAGLSMAEIAALAAAGLLTASELAKYNQMRPPGYNYTFTPASPSDIFSRGLVNPGVNPGEVLGAIRPAYQTTQPYQQQYYWGQQPYFAQRSDLVNYNQIPGGLPPPDYQPTPWFAQPAAYELPVYGPGMNIVGGTR